MQPTDPTTLQEGSLIGFKTDGDDIITLAIIQDNINIHRCNVKDVADDIIHQNVSWNNIYLLYSVHENRNLFKKNDECYAIWKNIEYIRKKKRKRKEIISFTTVYYPATFLHKDLRKKEIKVKYQYGTEGETHILPVDLTIYQYQYPSTIKPMPAVQSDAYEILKSQIQNSTQQLSQQLSQQSTQPQNPISTDSTPNDEPPSNHYNATQNMERLAAVTQRNLTETHRKQRTQQEMNEQHVTRVLNQTIQRANINNGPNRKTQISASTKLAFVRRYNESSNKNAQQILREMKNEKYRIGKNPKIYEWIKNGQNYYNQLIVTKGDVLKLSYHRSCVYVVVYIEIDDIAP